MTWLIDLDGVIWRGRDAVPGAAEAVARIRASGERVAFVTNNSSQRVGAYERRLAEMGIMAEGAVITSAMVAATMVQPGERVLLCAGEGVEEALEARGANVVRGGGADAVMVGYHRDFDYERLARAVSAVIGGARLVATNDDPTYPSDEGLLPGAGAILAAVVTASEAVPEVAGKPYPPSVTYVRERFGSDGVVVGDRPSTDGKFASALGYKFGLVLSGVTTAADLPASPAPWRIAPDLASLTARALRERGADG